MVVLLLALAASAQTKEPKAAAIPKESTGGPGAEECEAGANLPGVQCMAQLQMKQDRSLNAVYRAAIRALPENDSWDNRRNRAQLVKAQRAWLQYRTKHCTVVGAQEGGSNMSITFASQLCESSLTEERIRFLESVAANK